MDAYIKKRFESLKKQAEERNLRCEPVSSDIVVQRQELTDQLKTLMASMAPAQRNRFWSMSELTVRLKGKYREHPHPQAIAAALRSLGWTYTRLWGAEWEGRRMWKPNRTF